MTVGRSSASVLCDWSMCVFCLTPTSMQSFSKLRQTRRAGSSNSVELHYFGWRPWDVKLCRGALQSCIWARPVQDVVYAGASKMDLGEHCWTHLLSHCALVHASLTPACLFFRACVPEALSKPTAWLLSRMLAAVRFFSSSIFFNRFSVFCFPLPLPWN